MRLARCVEQVDHLAGCHDTADGRRQARQVGVTRHERFRAGRAREPHEIVVSGIVRQLRPGYAGRVPARRRRESPQEIRWHQPHSQQRTSDGGAHARLLPEADPRRRARMLPCASARRAGQEPHVDERTQRRRCSNRGRAGATIRSAARADRHEPRRLRDSSPLLRRDRTAQRSSPRARPTSTPAGLLPRARRRDTPTRRRNADLAENILIDVHRRLDLRQVPASRQHAVMKESG